MRRTRFLLSLLPLALILTACSGSDHGATGAGSVAATIGPSGGVIKGPAQTELEGVIVTIPAGAFAAIHEVVLESAPGLTFPGAVPVGTALRLRVSPDPGLLALPLTVRVRVSLPAFLPSNDLRLLVGSQTVSLSGQLQPMTVRPGSGGVITGNRKFFTGSTLRTGVMQAFRSERSRKPKDANKLLNLGLTELGKGRLASIGRAGFWFESGLEADPFASDLRFLAGLSRLLRLLSSEDDGTSSIDSIGEALRRMGFTLSNRGLYSRLIEGDWNLQFAPEVGAPQMSELVDFLDRRALPELAAIQRDLAFVGDDVHLRLDMSLYGQAFLGGREVDLGEVDSVRAFVAGLSFVVQHLERYDLDADIRSIHDKLQGGGTLQSLLGAFPKLATARVSPRSTEASALYDFLYLQREAMLSILRETDDQRDDLLVFANWFDKNSRDEVFNLSEQALDSLARGFRIRTRMPRTNEFLLVDLRAFFSNKHFSPRDLLPEISGNDLIGPKIPDPSVGGLLPTLTAEQVTQDLELPTRAKLTSATIRIDGAFGDWPSQSEVLLPADPQGDAHNQGKLPAIDLHRVYLARSGDQLAVRVTLADGNPRPGTGFATLYRITLEDRAGKGRAASRRELLVDLGTTRARAWLLEPSELPGKLDTTGPGVPGTRSTEIPVALGSLGFELAAPLASFGTPPRERVLEVRSSSLDRSRGTAGGDGTRRVFLTF